MFAISRDVMKAPVGVRKSLFVLVALCGACFPAFGDQSKADSKWPSFVFYGTGQNQRIDSSLYFREQEGKIPSEPMSGNSSGNGAIGSGVARPSPVSGDTHATAKFVKPYFSNGRR
ncbi:hypothetical protein DBIPINDM_005046 [Mesorhizobium sp. AR02]|uniref:hypothetical protein n=1 Tax=Mesorhizobium sp. AR02 TaxID=2865837 RepID=UPI00215E88A2|nr:hypothetical protein [Mesorhizobium sp. AR02]UVK51740.1 hypothetical protein DBIPINDM_005046 [Mesorhizobium sp. AR02]